MERPTAQLLFRGLASICPLPGLAGRIQDRLTPVLSQASLFVSPRTYSRFAVSVAVLPLPFEAAAFFLLPLQRAALMVAALGVLQALPGLAPLSRANSRRRAAEAELPFFLMTLSVLAHEADPSLQEGFRRVAAIGSRVFPAFTREADVLARDATFVSGSPASVVQGTFSLHPSRKLRAFVQGFLKTLETRKEVSEFVRQETSLQIQKLEQSWSAFGQSVGSLAEVTFILLALFPVGLEMIGATISGFASSLLFVASFGLLLAAGAAFLVLMDGMQPIVHDDPPSALWLGLSLLAWALSTVVFQSGGLGAREYVLAVLCVSALGFYQTRKRHSRIRRGEEEMGSMLHDLAEESRAGVSLPDAVSGLGSRASSFPSIGQSILTFHQSTRLGLTPVEAQRRVKHPSWLVRLGFAILSIAFETGAGFEHLEELSTTFRRVSDARRGVANSMIPFLLVGAVVPVISVAAITFLAGFAQESVPMGLGSFFSRASQSSLILSVATVATLSGVLLSKLLTQTVRHQVALPVLMASTLVSLVVFGVA